MCHFPNINYQAEFVILENEWVHVLPPSPRALYTLLQNKHLVDARFLDGIHNMEELEYEIFNCVDYYPENSVSLERIFYLIQIWGGRTGRGLFINQDFDWSVFSPAYTKLVNVCRNIENLDGNTCEAVFSAITSFIENLHEIEYKGMGVAFITKHTRFWMHRNLPNDMLPIYDSTFSNHIMHRGNSATLRDLPIFWSGMIKKATEESISLTALERQLFNHFQNPDD